MRPYLRGKYLDERRPSTLPAEPTRHMGNTERHQLRSAIALAGGGKTPNLTATLPQLIAHIFRGLSRNLQAGNALFAPDSWQGE
jgi:hypothetical protein